MATKKPPPTPEPLRTYRLKVRPGQPQIFYDRVAFARRLPVDYGCPDRITLFKKIAGRLYPNHFEWHDWTERTIKPLVEGNWCGFTGCSNSAKTYNVVGFATIWWLCAPDISSVTLVSTSKQSLRKRGWAMVQSMYSEFPEPKYGNFIDSRMIWQNTKGDDKHAIFGKAVEEGPIAKVADDIKGVHTTRQMVIIDEATAVPAAIFDAVSNLYSYPDEFLLVVIGNARSKLDQFGCFIEPDKGWESVTVNDDEWESRPQLNNKKAVVVHFDAEKSPNIVEGKVVSKHLPMKEKVLAAKANGETPLYWSNFKGFPPPDGLTKTVFSESALIANDGFGHHNFTGRNFRIIGTCDPAYGGGDRPVLRFAKMGEIEEGKMGIECMAPIILPIDISAKNPIHFQLAEQIRRQCESFVINGVTYSCQPENLGIDDTGSGGLCDIINRTWSYNIIRIEFGGKPSDDSVSMEDSRPASEVYLNKTTEMHFRARNTLNHKQLRGIDRETAKELCDRLFIDDKRLVKLESKEDYKKRHNGVSPDFGDSLVMLLEVARQRGFQLAAVGKTINRVQDWTTTVQKSQQVYEEVDYVEEEIEPVETLL